MELTSAEKTDHRYFVKAYNKCSKIRKTPQLDSGMLIEIAEKKTGLRDWGDTLFLKGLNVMVQSVNNDTKLHDFGRQFIKNLFLNRLKQRLLIRDILKKKPEINEIPIEKSIFVGGFPRTGTTLLQRILAKDERFHAPKYWEIEYPVPERYFNSEIVDLRKIKSQVMLNILYYLTPELKKVHYMEADSPEECYPLLERSFVCIDNALMGDFPEYIDWLWSINATDMNEVYRFYKEQLRLILFYEKAKPLLLKAPSHLWSLKALVNVLPDIKIICPHRHPSTMFASLASLISVFRRVTYNEIDLKHIGSYTLSIVKLYLDKYMRARKELPVHHFFDIKYSDFVKSPLKTVEIFYNELNLTLTPNLIYKMNLYNKLSVKKMKQLGNHTYNLDVFGISTKKLNSVFEEYISTYLN